MSAWLWSLRALFAMEAASFALLIPRIPDIRDALALSPSELGVALLGIPIGSLAGFLVAPRVVRRLGSERVAWGGVAALALCFALVGTVESLPPLVGALTLAGIGVAHTEIALNAQASLLEARSGRPTLSGGHGFWSLGSIVGVLGGGLLAQVGVPVMAQTATTAALLVPCAFLVGRRLGRGPRAPTPRAMSLPPPALLPVCLMPVGVMAIEGVFMDWSALFLTDTLAVDPFAASLGYLAFSVAMAGARLAGDRVTARIGLAAHAVASCAVAAGGSLVFAAAAQLPTALLGAFLAGLGAASIYPIALGIAARRPGAVEDNLAAVAFTSFLLLLGVPAAFGLLVEGAGQRGAFALVALLALPSALLAWRAASASPDGHRTESRSLECL